MLWTVNFILSLICLLLSFIFAFVRSKQRYKSGRLLDTTKILFIGVAVSSLLLFIPIYYNIFKEGQCGIFETLLISVHNMIRLFIVDGEFEFITSNLYGLPQALFKCYTVMFSILFVLAPVLTFGFVLSFFRNVSAYMHYISNCKTDAFIFSELNDKSLTLAKSLYDNDPKKRLFVFADVFEKDEHSFELIEKAKEIGAICFKKDITIISFDNNLIKFLLKIFNFFLKIFNLFARRKKEMIKRELSFFAIGNDESENINQALKLIDTYKFRDGTNLYVFSTQAEAEILLANAFNKNASKDDEHNRVKIKVRRVNEVRSLVSRTLYDTGFEKIFKTAYADESGIKMINALVIGMGQHGTEMTKALSWFCQMDGYQVEINSFDINANAEEKFVSLCPELMDPKFNGRFDIKGEAKYKITIHSGIDVNTKTFDDIISKLPRTTYVFVALGNDDANISTAIKLRMLCSRLGYDPQIHAIVYDSEKKEALTDIVNFRNQAYRIDFIGDLKMSYSEEVILDSEVEKEALKRHMKWGTESSFWQYDYNYKSSTASAIHRKMKILNQIPGIEKEPNQRTEDELWNIRVLEHCRWDAYMRAEGYVYGGTVEKSGRNDIAKMHNCLVPFYDLPYEEQIKDDD